MLAQQAKIKEVMGSGSGQVSVKVRTTGIQMYTPCVSLCISVLRSTGVGLSNKVLIHVAVHVKRHNVYLLLITFALQREGTDDVVAEEFMVCLYNAC